MIKLPEVVDLIAFYTKNPLPMLPFLIGGYMLGDIVREAKQESWIDRQIRLELMNEKES